MNKNFRRNLCVLMATMLVTFALPSAATAPDKIFSLQMQITSATFNPPFTVKATITNLSPQGNSSIDSFTLAVTGLTIVDVAQPASGFATKTSDRSVAVTN